MDFGALPPEINSARMYSGPGAGPIMAAATAWKGVAAELNATAASYGSVVTRLSGEEWLGAASTSMAEAAAPYVAWMNSAGAQAELIANRALAAAAAYEQAFAMTVPPPMIAANRALLQQLVATNVVGQNTPAIASTETQYGEFWAQDAAAMYGYAGHAAAATQIKPFTQPPQTTNPTGAATQAATVSHATASKSLTSTGNALQALTTPAAATTGTTPAATTPTSTSTLSSLCSLFKSPALSAANSTYSNFIHSANFGARGICAVWRGLSGGMGATKMAGTAAKAAAGAAQAAGGAAKAAVGLGAVGSLGGIAGHVGKAGLIGAMSVPPGWAPPAPAAVTTGFVSGGTWEPLGGMAGTVHEAAAQGVPGMPGVPAATGGMGRGAAFSAPRYGARVTVMPRPPIGG